MRSLLSFMCLVLIGTLTLQGQTQEDTQKKTTTKKVRVTDDNQVTTKVVEDVDAEVDVIEVEGTNELNQKKTVIKKNADKTAVVGEDRAENVSNKIKVAEKKQMRQTELERSIQMQKEKAEQERLAMEKKKMEMMEALKKRRAELEHRPKGIVKLKDPDGDGIN